MFQSDLDDSLPRLLELGSPLADVERAGGVEVDVPGPGDGHGERCSRGIDCTFSHWEAVTIVLVF